MARRVPIDRRMVTRETSDTIVLFRDAWGEVDKRFDLGKLGLPGDVTALLAAAFRGHCAGLTAETRRHFYGSLRVFAAFAQEENAVAGAADVTSTMVGRYRAWLDRQMGTDGKGWSASSKANTLAVLRQLIDWIKRHAVDFC